MNKNKGFIVGALGLLLTAGLYLFLNSNEVTLKSDVMNVEYGDEIDFVNEEILETTDPKILEILKIDQSKIDFEAGEDYPKVGEHILVVTYKELFRTQSKNLTLVVADTKSPRFIEAPESIEITTDDLNHDFTTYFEAEDLSEFELIIDTDLVDFEKEGMYDAQAIATDIYGNQITNDFKIIIEVEKVKAEELEESEEPEEPAETLDTNDPVTEVPKEESDSAPVNRIIPTIKNGILIVNKKHPLPANYAPGEDPVAVAHLDQIIREMQRLGYDISDDYSGFRTYDYQKNLYERYVSNDGQEAADTYSARPGYSEHQTGLTFDLKHWDGTLVTKEAEAQWIAANAANYGFIVRYQVGKEHITGYQAEPWHLRYIGDEATSIYSSGLTLEEYLGVDRGDYHDE